MTTTTNWFDVSKKGLAEIVARRGYGWLIHELLSNAWDEKSTKVEVQVTPHDGKPLVTIVVTDDNPEGFKDLRDAWTLFAPSKKKGDAEQRGRFNLGEKLVLAACVSASIRTTTGAVLFDHRGRHAKPTWKTERGSIFEGDIRMTRAELEGMLAAAQLVVPPIPTTINGKLIEYRTPDLEILRVVLPTEIADPEGYLKRTQRQTDLRLYKPRPGEVATLYEMGIPVVETGDSFHVDVRQKVPLNMERDNVTPAYLAAIRGYVLNHATHQMLEEHKSDSWVTAAIESPTFDNPDALAEVLTARFGINRVAYDPSDREANDIAASKGYKVIHGGSLPGAVWDKVKAAGLIQPAGQVTPSPKPFSEDGERLKTIDERDCSPKVQAGIEVYRWLGKRLLGFEPRIVIGNDPSWRFGAAWSKSGFVNSGTLTLNLWKLGERHFTTREEIYRLAIHEFAHHYESNHLAEGFHEACCKLGAKLAALFDEIGGGHLAIQDDRNIKGLSSDALSRRI